MQSGMEQMPEVGTVALEIGIVMLMKNLHKRRELTWRQAFWRRTPIVEPGLQRRLVRAEMHCDHPSWSRG